MSDKVEPQMNGALLTREAIMASGQHLRLETVRTPEWGDEDSYVYIRGLSGADAGAVQAVAAEHAAKTADEGRVWAHWCILGVCDKAGNRILGEDDVDGLLASPLAALQRCTMAIMKLNGITAESEAEKKTA